MEYVSRCPACSSLVRPGQDWCTLCHADLRPPQPEAPQPEAAEPGGPAEALSSVETAELGEHDWAALPEPSTLLLADRGALEQTSAAPVLGKHARHAAPEELDPSGGARTVPLAEGERAPLVGSPLPEAEMSQLLAQLAAESADPLGGVMGRLPDSQGMRVLVALAAGGTVAVVLVGVSWLLGLIFG